MGAVRRRPIIVVIPYFLRYMFGEPAAFATHIAELCALPDASLSPYSNDKNQIIVLKFIDYSDYGVYEQNLLCAGSDLDCHIRR